MNCYLAHLAVIDLQDSLHKVSFTTGLNVITGKSSTGKSALIDIFDYCFGSSEDTIPDGVISDSAQLFFTVLKFSDSWLVLARKRGAKKLFIRESKEDIIENTPADLLSDFFEDNFFLQAKDFKAELGRYFGLEITDVETSKEDAVYRRRKKATPSVRSFTSFMLQHQNLVANKHALFYRFDEKEKREQAIEHLKIFLGLVDQQYYLTMQDLADARSKLTQLQNQLPKKQYEKKQKEDKIRALLNEYSALTGTPLVDTDEKIMVQNPAKWQEKLESVELKIDTESDEFSAQLLKLEKSRSEAMVELRKMEIEHRNVQSSINYADRYMGNIEELNYPKSANELNIECPFCHSESSPLSPAINDLEHAVNWLNSELRKSPYMKESFKSDQSKISNEISVKRAEVSLINSEIRVLENQISEISKRQSLHDAALKVKLRIENYLEDLLDRPSEDLEQQIKNIEGEIKDLQKQIRGYKLKEYLENYESFINKNMNQIADGLDFESSYKPLNLHFSLSDFDLYNLKPGKKKVFLRSMGSGANWLYCHLVLFLSLHKLFCTLGDECKIPPILFLDQPSQVYFPNANRDDNEKFTPEELAALDKVDQTDHDIKSVERFFSEIAIQCDKIEKEDGWKPQIIISDHVDDLNLEEDYNFEDFVRARWRTRGFIEV